MKALILALMLAIPMVAKAKAPVFVSLNPADWTYITGTPNGSIDFLQPEPYLGTWKIQFPLVQDYPADFASVNYVTTNRFPRLAVGQTLYLTATLNASADAQFEYRIQDDSNVCDRPANFRFFFQVGFHDRDRWWSSLTQTFIQPGSHDIVMTVPIQPELWSDAVGEMATDSPAALKAFQKTVTKAKRLGVTFGGGCFFGHGVWLSRGRAEFILTTFNVE